MKAALAEAGLMNEAPAKEVLLGKDVPVEVADPSLAEDLGAQVVQRVQCRYIQLER